MGDSPQLHERYWVTQRKNRLLMLHRILANIMICHYEQLIPILIDSDRNIDNQQLSYAKYRDVSACQRAMVPTRSLLTQAVVILRQSSLALKNLDIYRGLVVLVGGEELIFLRRDMSVTLHDRRHHTPNGFDSLRHPQSNESTIVDD